MSREQIESKDDQCYKQFHRNINSQNKIFLLKCFLQQTYQIFIYKNQGIRMAKSNIFANLNGERRLLVRLLQIHKQKLKINYIYMGSCVGSEKLNKKIEFNSPIFNKTECSLFIQKTLRKILSKCAINPFKITLIFRASENNFSAEKFHEKTDGINNSFVIVKTDENRIFGGFSPCTWQKNTLYKYQKDENGKSFLFRFVNSQHNDKKADQKEKKLKIEHYQITARQYSIMNHHQSGPIFGQGHDIFINNRCNKQNNWNNMGKSYSCPYPFGSVKANQLLASKSSFLITEYQVWAIQPQ